jgi:hypothetical protein
MPDDKLEVGMIEGHHRHKVRLRKTENREVVSIPDRTSRTGAGRRKVPAPSNRSAAHSVARIAAHTVARSGVLLRAAS